jgi:hypothetical protein
LFVLTCFDVGVVVAYAGHDSRVLNVSFSHRKYAFNSCGGGGLPEPSGTGSGTIRNGSIKIAAGAAAAAAGAAGSKNSSRSRGLPSLQEKHFQMISGSADGTARVWRHGSTDAAAIVFSHYRHSLSHGSGALLGSTSGVSGAKLGGGMSMGAGTFGANSANATKALLPSARNKPFGDAVTFSSYYYMDKFVVLVSRIFSIVKMLHFIFLCMFFFAFLMMFFVQIDRQSIRVAVSLRREQPRGARRP